MKASSISRLTVTPYSMVRKRGHSFFHSSRRGEACGWAGATGAGVCAAAVPANSAAAAAIAKEARWREIRTRRVSSSRHQDQAPSPTPRARRAIDSSKVVISLRRASALILPSPR